MTERVVSHPDLAGAPWLEVPATMRLRTAFDIDGPLGGAVLHLAGQGVVLAWLNGVPVNPGHIEPARVDIVRALARTHEVTRLLRPGANTLDFVLGTGTWSWHYAGLPPRLRAQLVVDLADGSQVRVHPGADSLIAPSAIEIEEPWYIERIRGDFVDEGGGLRLGEAAVLASVPHPVTASTPPADVLRDPGPAVRVVSTQSAAEVGRPGRARVFDVGENIAGRARLTVASGLPPGTVLRLVHGELLDESGHVSTRNIRGLDDTDRERQVVEWVSAGTPGEVVEALLSYHGFRYVEVHGLPDDALAELVGLAIHSDLRPSGTIRTDSPLVDRLLGVAERTYLNNAHSAPEDCPTREQAPWAGDAASVMEFALAAFDSRGYLEKWIGDLLTSQRADGSMPPLAPNNSPWQFEPEPVWGSALHRAVLGHWLHYGDADLVRSALPALRRWIDVQLGWVGDRGVVDGGPAPFRHDWLAIEPTDPEILHTHVAIECLDSVARLEADVGDPDFAGLSQARAARLRAAARSVFTSDGEATQAALACAIDGGWLTLAGRDAAAARLEEQVRAFGNRVAGGYGSMRTIVRALAATGRSSVLVDVLAQPAQPGIGAMLAQGPGTFWERHWIDPERAGTGSLDHIGLGGPFGSWAWEGLAGLRPIAAGYREFVVEPQFVEPVRRLSVETVRPPGTIRLSYERDDDEAELSLTVPAGARAHLRLGANERAPIGPGMHRMRVPVPGIRPSRVTPATPLPDPGGS
jgi:alpha-L-rhamnosidase